MATMCHRVVGEGHTMDGPKYALRPHNDNAGCIGSAYEMINVGQNNRCQHVHVHICNTDAQLQIYVAGLLGLTSVLYTGLAPHIVFVQARASTEVPQSAT